MPKSATEIARRANDKGMTLESLESASFWMNIAVVVFTVAAAVAGVLALYFGTRLSDAKDKDFERFKTVSAATIASADARAAEANEKAAEASEVGGRLAFQTEELKKQNLATEKRLEQERLARIEIEEKVAFRRISQKQRSDAASRLMSFPRQIVSIWFKAGDHEGLVFASDIASMLETAKWDVFAPASMMSFAGSGRRGHTPVETGVTVSSSGHETSLKASEALVKELGALGFDVRKSPTIEQRDVPVVIVNVETRPEGAQGEAKLRKQRKPQN